ncbi:MAG TPA: MlaD family protein [Burkholderiales bacterium]|nr:MlaD family protein [Burkholderiales bacterium]
MNDPRPKRDFTQDLPRAVTDRPRWRSLLVWIVPLVAAIVAGYLVFDRVRQYGPEITVHFKDGGGVRVGQTPVRYRGVPIGEVTKVELADDLGNVAIGIRLQRSAAAIAKEGSTFWIVRPEVGFGSISGLSTVITGPEIQVVPGNGAEKKEFEGLERAPAALEERGLKVILRGKRLKSISRGSPVYYRGVEVGVVQAADLGSNSALVDVQVLIRQRYTSLVRSGSVFWNVSGVSMSGGIFKGVQLHMESLKSAASGGIEFATPSAQAPRAKEGEVFELNESAPKGAQGWQPRITLPSAE